jgi:hypothetical protein
LKKKSNFGKKKETKTKKKKEKRGKLEKKWKNTKKNKKWKNERNALWITVVIYSAFRCGETVISPHPLVICIITWQLFEFLFWVLF